MAPKFLSTHSRRVRLAAWGHRVQSPVYFNPRTHMECDRSITFLRLTSGLISIHALTWSATLVLLLCLVVQDNRFQSTHSHGVRQRAMRILVAQGLPKSANPFCEHEIFPLILTKISTNPLMTRGANLPGILCALGVRTARR